MLMVLGDFVFELSTLPFQNLARNTKWRQQANKRMQGRPSLQFTGVDGEEINLRGMLYPEITGGKVALDTVRDMGHSGDTWPLINGLGEQLGIYGIGSVEENHSEFWPNGEAKKIEFTIRLIRSDDDRVDQTNTAAP